MPRPYPPEFRRRALDLVESGRTIREVAASLGIAESCLHRWRHRDLVDRGLKPGTTARESEELAAALNELTLAQRRVLLLRYFGELSFEEIAGTLGCPLGTALSHCRRGLAALRKLLTAKSI